MARQSRTDWLVLGTPCDVLNGFFGMQRAARMGQLAAKLSTRLLMAFLLSVLAHQTVAEQHSSQPNGKSVYKKANCIGCHKWHGGGGGGYGGVALSLRETTVDAETLALIIRCGRPGTRMPYHDRRAYRGDDRSCYDTTKSELGDAAPPRARTYLRDKEVAAVTDYVVTHIQGKGKPDYSDCVAFWGADAKRCRAMQKNGALK